MPEVPRESYGGAKGCKSWKGPEMCFFYPKNQQLDPPKLRGLGPCFFRRVLLDLQTFHQ